MYVFNCSRVKEGLIVDNADMKCLCSTLQTDMPLFSRAYKAAYEKQEKITNKKLEQKKLEKSGPSKSN